MFAPKPVALRADTPDGVRVFLDGRTRAMPDSERFVAPLSNTLCVVGHIAYTIPDAANQRAQPIKFERIHNRPFIVEGEDVEAVVDAAHLVLRVPKRRTMTVTEQSIPVGAYVRVSGTVMRDGGALPETDVSFREGASVLRLVGSRRDPVTVALL